jgi:hypothetical protein
MKPAGRAREREDIRDWEFIEDAAFCIAQEVRKEAALPSRLWAAGLRRAETGRD